MWHNSTKLEVCINGTHHLVCIQAHHLSSHVSSCTPSPSPPSPHQQAPRSVQCSSTSAAGSCHLRTRILQPSSSLQRRLKASHALQQQCSQQLRPPIGVLGESAAAARVRLPPVQATFASAGEDDSLVNKHQPQVSSLADLQLQGSAGGCRRPVETCGQWACSTAQWQAWDAVAEGFSRSLGLVQQHNCKHRCIGSQSSRHLEDNCRRICLQGSALSQSFKNACSRMMKYSTLPRVVVSTVSLADPSF